MSRKEIEYVIDGYTKGLLPDYQISSLLMAIKLNGMNLNETVNLTRAMLHSGDINDLSSIKNVTVDKHSTGGVGDKTCFCGLCVLGEMRRGEEDVEALLAVDLLCTRKPREESAFKERVELLRAAECRVLTGEEAVLRKARAFLCGAAALGACKVAELEEAVRGSTALCGFVVLVTCEGRKRC